jgi:hypothetical protein
MVSEHRINKATEDLKLRSRADNYCWYVGDIVYVTAVKGKKVRRLYTEENTYYSLEYINPGECNYCTFVNVQRALEFMDKTVQKDEQLGYKAFWDIDQIKCQTSKRIYEENNIRE